VKKGASEVRRPKTLFAEVSFRLHDDAYPQNVFIGVRIEDEVVPVGEDPVAFLRRRVIEELDRRTLSTIGPDSDMRGVHPLRLFEPVEDLGGVVEF